jgi:hypothetical protein
MVLGKQPYDPFGGGLGLFYYIFNPFFELRRRVYFFPSRKGAICHMAISQTP